MSRRSSVDFVVVGAQRAGSTHLAACLQDHPGLYLCPDEVPYFEDPFFVTTPPSALAPALAGARLGQRAGIQRPEYLAHPECPTRIHAHSPRLASSPSCATRSSGRCRPGSGTCSSAGCRSCPWMPESNPSSRAAPIPPTPTPAEILEYGFYGRHLRRYVDVFGAERVLVLLNEDLRETATFARVYDFLGVDPTHRPAPTQARTNAGVYEARRLRVLRARRSLVWSWDGVVTYTYRPRRRRRPLAFLPNAAVVAFDRVVLARMFGNPRPGLRPDLEDRLRALYAADVEVVESLLQRDLSAWKTPTPRSGS